MTTLHAHRPRFAHTSTPDSHDYGTRPYDLVKEFVTALSAVTALSLVLAGTSASATSGPPYDDACPGQSVLGLKLQKWSGVGLPTDSADLVLEPLRQVTGDLFLAAALRWWDALSPMQQAAYAAPDVVDTYRTSGYTDPGEMRALEAVADQARGRVLDVGVGGGRSTALLAPDARAYVGVDVAAGMVALARGRFPGVDLRVMDVCDLGELRSASFDLVVFSFNGIDALDHEHRAVAMAELARVLAPGGRLVISSLTLDGISYDERPWTIHLSRPRVVAYRTVQLLLHPLRWVRSVQNYRRLRRHAVRGDDWAMSPMRAHEYRFLVHFATIGSTVRMLAQAGLAVEQAWDERGLPVDPSVERAPVHYVHYVCRQA